MVGDLVSEPTMNRPNVRVAHTHLYATTDYAKPTSDDKHFVANIILFKLMTGMDDPLRIKLIFFTYGVDPSTAHF